jgi:hypothetical protein
MAAEISGARRRMAAPGRNGLDRIERQGHLDAVSAGP